MSNLDMLEIWGKNAKEIGTIWRKPVPYWQQMANAGPLTQMVRGMNISNSHEYVVVIGEYEINSHEQGAVGSYVVSHGQKCYNYDSQKYESASIIDCVELGSSKLIRILYGC